MGKFILIEEVDDSEKNFIEFENENFQKLLKENGIEKERGLTHKHYFDILLKYKDKPYLKEIFCNERNFFKLIQDKDSFRNEFFNEETFDSLGSTWEESGYACDIFRRASLIDADFTIPIILFNELAIIDDIEIRLYYYFDEKTYEKHILVTVDKVTYNFIVENY